MGLRFIKVIRRCAYKCTCLLQITRAAVKREKEEEKASKVRGVFRGIRAIGVITGIKVVWVIRVVGVIRLIGAICVFVCMRV